MRTRRTRRPLRRNVSVRGGPGDRLESARRLNALSTTPAIPAGAIRREELMAKQQKKAGGKVEDKERKLGVKKRAIRDLEPRGGGSVKGGTSGTISRV